MNGLVWFSRLLKISQAKLVPDRHLDEALLSRSARICFSGITSGACINRYWSFPFRPPYNPPFPGSNLPPPFIPS